MSCCFPAASLSGLTWKAVDYCRASGMSLYVNSTVEGEGSGAEGGRSGLVIGSAVVCAVGAVAVMVAVVYRYLRRGSSGRMWLSKIYSKDEYSSMQDESPHSGKEDRFIIGFANPMMDIADQKDGHGTGVEILAYRPLDADTADREYSVRYKFLFPRDRLTYGTEIGSTWFGKLKVFEGEASRIIPGIRRTKVIIKRLEEGQDSHTKLRFLKELDVLRRIEHKNVMGILGQALEMDPYLVVFEYAQLGDLKKFLISHRSAAKSIEERGLLLRMSIDIASGLNCLHANNIYHSDLAARNCIVAPDLTVKIGDYGVGRCLYKDDYYSVPNSPEESIPLRWLAPDSIAFNVNSGLVVNPPCIKTNIWSFGVTLWEVVGFGVQPYEDLTDDEVIQSVLIDRLYQLPEPRNTCDISQLLYEVMKTCWAEPFKRRSMKEIETSLMSLMSRPTTTAAVSDDAIPEPTPPSDPSQKHGGYQQPVAVVKPLQHISTEGHPTTHLGTETENTKNRDDDILIEAYRARQGHTMIGQAPTLDGQGHTIIGQAPTIIGESPTLDGQAPTIVGQAPTIVGQAPTLDGQGHTLDDDVEISNICDQDVNQLPDVTSSNDVIPITEIDSVSSVNACNSLESPDVDFTTAPPPVTYIGEPPEGVRAVAECDRHVADATHDGIEPSIEGGRILEVKYSEGPDGRLQPSVIIESQPSGYVVLPNETVRRKSSLRQANAVSQGKSVHYPMNILDLRVIHRYYKEEEDEDVAMETSYDNPLNKQETSSTHQHTGGQDVTIATSTDQLIITQDRTDRTKLVEKASDMDMDVEETKFDFVKDSRLSLAGNSVTIEHVGSSFDHVDSSVDHVGSSVDHVDSNVGHVGSSDDRPTSPKERLRSPVEKKMKKTFHKSKTRKDQEDEWLISIDQVVVDEPDG